MKKTFLLSIMLVLMLTVSAVFADDLSDVKQAGVLRFGAPLEYIPFVFEDDSGKTDGMDIALMQEICRRMGVQLQPISLARDGIIDALNIGQIDVIGGGLSKTEERALRIDFSRAYYNGEAQVIALASLTKPANVSAESLRGMKLGVVKGSSFQEWTQKNLVNNGILPASSVYTYAHISDAMKALDRKDIDMVMTDQDVYEDRYRDSGNYQVFYTGFKTENYAFGARKDSSLIPVINQHLSDMIKDGTAQNIANRYFSMNFSYQNDGIVKPVATLAPATVVPVSTGCVNAMSYVADVTINDGTTFNPNAGFRKTWRIYNNGTCAWDSNYVLDFVSGDRMNGGAARVPGTVKPGQTVDISVDLTAPNRAGNYKGYWQMRSPQGSGFGQTIWVSIKVSGNAPQPTARPSDGQTRTIPVIDYFYADSYSGNSGDGTTIHWGTSKAVGVTIYVDGYNITNANASGSYQLQAPLQGAGNHTITLTAHSVTDDTSSSITYTMSGSSGGGNDGQTQTIPVIEYFYADSYSGNPGDGTTIHWGTSKSIGVTIYVDGYNITNADASGSYQLQAPLQGAGDHTITITAHSVTDDSSDSLTYTMSGSSSGGPSSGEDGQTRTIPSIDYFYADSDSGYSGDGTTVYWSTTNAGGVTISVDGYTISNEGPSGSCPLQAPLQGAGTHTITLTAHSVTDDASSSITYTMMERASESYPTPTVEPENNWEVDPETLSEDQWNAIVETMTEEEWNSIEEQTLEDMWNDAVENMTIDDLYDVFNNMSEEDLEYLMQDNG